MLLSNPPYSKNGVFKSTVFKSAVITSSVFNLSWFLRWFFVAETYADCVAESPIAVAVALACATLVTSSAYFDSDCYSHSSVVSRLASKSCIILLSYCLRTSGGYCHHYRGIDWGLCGVAWDFVEHLGFSWGLGVSGGLVDTISDYIEVFWGLLGPLEGHLEAFLRSSIFWNKINDLIRQNQRIETCYTLRHFFNVGVILPNTRAIW